MKGWFQDSCFYCQAVLAGILCNGAEECSITAVHKSTHSYVLQCTGHSEYCGLVGSFRGKTTGATHCQLKNVSHGGQNYIHDQCQQSYKKMEKITNIGMHRIPDSDVQSAKLEMVKCDFSNLFLSQQVNIQFGVCLLYYWVFPGRFVLNGRCCMNAVSLEKSYVNRRMFCLWLFLTWWLLEILLSGIKCSYTVKLYIPET